MRTHNMVKFPAFLGFDSLLNDLLTTTDYKVDGFKPKVNIKEQEDGFHIAVVAPGFQKDALKVTLENDLLTIAGTNEAKQEETTEKFVRKEFVAKSFSRSFNVDGKIKADGISAKYEDGILNVWLPKLEPTPKVQAAITIQ